MAELPDLVEHKMSCFMSSTSSYASLAMDSACLLISNTDATRTLDIHTQSSECYKCSFWPLHTLAPNSSVSLSVNTTYSTIFSIQDMDHHLYGLSYHFSERGNYSLRLNRSQFDLEMVHQPVNVYMPILFAFLFYFLLFLLWQFSRFLKSRMDGDDESRPMLGARGSSYGGVDADHETSNGTVMTETEAVTQTEAVTGRVMTETEAVAVDKKRLRSLDVFRGITITLMIFVNYGGGRYYFFNHSPWNGLTVADLVFPWFMWIMGVSMIYSMKSQLQRGTPQSTLIWRIVNRSVVLFLLGIFVNGISSNFVPTFRIPGVLQRFAICYLLSALMEVFFSHSDEGYDPAVWGLWWLVRDIVLSWVQWAVVIGLASIHTVITYVMPVPGCPRGYVGPGGLHDFSTHPKCTGGAAGYIDRLVISPGHMYQGSSARKVYQNTEAFDPEGILGCMTCMLVVQFGAACGRLLTKHSKASHRLVRLITWAVSSGTFAGILCSASKEDGVVPVNKNLWSLSYVLATSCFAFLFFALIYYIVDHKEYWNGNPFRFAGLNPILLYVGHELTRKVFPFSWTPVDPSHGEHLLMNLWAVTLWLFIAYVCHLKKIYISV